MKFRLWAMGIAAVIVVIGVMGSPKRSALDPEAEAGAFIFLPLIVAGFVWLAFTICETAANKQQRAEAVAATRKAARENPVGFALGILMFTSVLLFFGWLILATVGIL